ncbi:hypothetical protein [Paenibacillus sp. 453mf]|uniref:hypothetical protein n=1 Tax=Paenibacillus sp. 453mf TaxID=1761874 RepID=UPI0008EFDB15|nr:hypothetical protein [Paenibacillus sp. 453mf]SFT00506.1 hypothetical protein SAMN04488601_11910 [Paenibacillus sp. 453mf]
MGKFNISKIIIYVLEVLVLIGIALLLFDDFRDRFMRLSPSEIQTISTDLEVFRNKLDTETTRTIISGFVFTFFAYSVLPIVFVGLWFFRFMKWWREKRKKEKELHLDAA